MKYSSDIKLDRVLVIIGDKDKINNEFIIFGYLT